MVRPHERPNRPGNGCDRRGGGWAGADPAVADQAAVHASHYGGDADRARSHHGAAGIAVFRAVHAGWLAVPAHPPRYIAPSKTRIGQLLVVRAPAARRGVVFTPIALEESHVAATQG